jgi:NAD(P)H-dependent FMN reductase
MTERTQPQTNIRPVEVPRPPAQPLTVAVIVGSTRPNRRGDVVATWLLGQLWQRSDLTVDFIDLAELELPAVLPSGDDEAARALRARVDAADAFIVVTPEYNHGYPASLKQAIDIPYREWNAKPVAFVSYGGMSGGTRAVEQLRLVFAELHAVTIRDNVAFPGTRIDDEGNPEDPERMQASAKVMLDQLSWWATALRAARHNSAYGN